MGIVLWISPVIVDAAVFLQQPIRSVTATTSLAYAPRISAGTGFNNTIDQLDLAFDQTFLSGGSYRVHVFECNTNDLSSCDDYIPTNAGGSEVDTSVSANFNGVVQQSIGHYIFCPGDICGGSPTIHAGGIPVTSSKYIVIVPFLSAGSAALYLEGTTNNVSPMKCTEPGSYPCGLGQGVPYMVFYDNSTQTQGDITYFKQIWPTRREATSSPTTLAALVHVGAVDLQSTTSVEVRITYQSLSQYGITPVGVLQTLAKDVYLSSPGDQLVQVSVAGLSAEYQAWFKANGAGFLDATTTTFTVGTSTAWGQLQLQQQDRQAEMAQALTSTSTSGYAGQCGVLFADTVAFGDCMQYLFIPSSNAIGDALIHLGSQFIQMLPMGYGYRFVVLWQQADQHGDVSMLPSLSFTLPTGYPGAGQSFDITPWNKLLGSGTVLSTATNPNTGHTIRDIVEPLWDKAVYAMVFVGLLIELFNFGGSASWGVAGEEQAASRGRAYGRGLKEGMS